MLDAAALAAILDPERKVPGWWKAAPIKCGNGSRDGVRDIYTGPANLHTAREHAWRLEDWLEARGYCWFREEYPYTKTHKTQVYKRLERTHDMAPSHQLIGDPDPNHTAALVAAIERIVNG